MTPRGAASIPDRRKRPGEYACWFIGNLTHTKGRWARQAFELRPWQRKFLLPLFGTIRDDGVRQYRTCYVEIPRKNGKSELAAAVGLYMLCGDGEEGAEVYSAACDLEQASITFNVAAQMVRNDPELSKVLEVIPSRRRIVHHKTGSFYRAIPSDEASAHGYNASAIICDELHAWKTRKLWDVLTTSTGARDQPLTFVITTAGWDRTTVCWEQHEYARKCLEGIVTDATFLPVLYHAPEEADWEDEAVWKACNPALGDFRSMDEMRAAAYKAKQIPAQQNSFRRLYLCQWTAQAGRAIDMKAWDAAATPTFTLADLKGQTCYAGLDLASTQDIAALALVFPQANGRYRVVPRFWIPEAQFGGSGMHPRDPHVAEILQEWSRWGSSPRRPGA